MLTAVAPQGWGVTLHIEIHCFFSPSEGKQLSV